MFTFSRYQCIHNLICGESIQIIKKCPIPEHYFTPGHFFNVTPALPVVFWGDSPIFILSLNLLSIMISPDTGRNYNWNIKLSSLHVLILILIFTTMAVEQRCLITKIISNLSLNSHVHWDIFWFSTLSFSCKICKILSSVGLGKVPLTKRRFSKINGSVR